MEHKLSLDIPPFPRKQFPTIMDLAVAALGNFKPAALQKVTAELSRRDIRTSCIAGAKKSSDVSFIFVLSGRVRRLGGVSTS